MSLTKTIALILSALCLLSLVSCVNTGSGDETTGTTPNDTTAPSDDTTVPPITDIFLSENGEAKYRIIRKDCEDEPLITMFVELKQTLDAMSGTSFGLAGDFKKPSDKYDSEKYEILFGNTGYDETAEVMNSIGYYDYAIRAVGHKIVIAAHTYDTLAAAVKYFTENVIEKKDDGNGNVTLKYLGDYTYDANIETLFTVSNPLSGYSVIYNKDNKEAADKFVAKVKSKYNVALTASDDSKAVTDKEILIGLTNREESKLLQDCGGIIYTIAEKNGKLVIGGSTASSTDLAMTTIINNYITNIYSNTMNFKKDYSESSIAYDGQSKELHGDANLRIMSYNILAELWNDKLPVAGRDYLVASTVLYYSPDVVGLQEVTDKWYAALKPLFGADYAFVHEKTTEKKTNYSTLAYNISKVKLLNSGMKIFSQGNSPQLRLADWGYFERLSDGKKFIVMNTHWDLTVELRLIQSAEMAQLAIALGAQYQCPVFTTGDYNSTETSEEYKNYVAQTGFNDAKLKCISGEGKYKTTHSVGSMPSASDVCIDHIFATPTVKIEYYTQLTEKAIINASDHIAIFADFVLE